MRRTRQSEAPAPAAPQAAPLVPAALPRVRIQEPEAPSADDLDLDRGRTVAMLASLGRVQLTLDLIERRLGRLEEQVRSIQEAQETLAEALLDVPAEDDAPTTDTTLDEAEEELEPDEELELGPEDEIETFESVEPEPEDALEEPALEDAAEEPALEDAAEELAPEDVAVEDPAPEDLPTSDETALEPAAELGSEADDAPAAEEAEAADTEFPVIDAADEEPPSASEGEPGDLTGLMTDDEAAKVEAEPEDTIAGASNDETEGEDVDEPGAGAGADPTDDLTPYDDGDKPAPETAPAAADTTPAEPAPRRRDFRRRDGKRREQPTTEA